LVRLKGTPKGDDVDTIAYGGPLNANLETQVKTEERLAELATKHDFAFYGRDTKSGPLKLLTQRSRSDDDSIYERSVDRVFHVWLCARRVVALHGCDYAFR
jgi:hypothetical protein